VTLAKDSHEWLSSFLVTGFDDPVWSFGKESFALRVRFDLRLGLPELPEPAIVPEGLTVLAQEAIHAPVTRVGDRARFVRLQPERDSSRIAAHPAESRADDAFADREN